MKIDKVRNKLYSFMNHYNQIYKEASAKDAFDGTVMVPVDHEIAEAVKEALSRINQRYPAATSKIFEWPKNILFELGFSVAMRPSPENETGLEYVMQELLSEKERQVLFLIYRDRLDHAKAAVSLNSNRLTVKDIEKQAFAKLRMPSSINIIENGPDALWEYEMKQKELQNITEEYTKQIDFLRHNVQLIDIVLKGEASKSEIQEMAALAKEQEQNMNVELEDLDLSVVTYKALKAEGFSHSGEFNGMSSKRLLKIRNIGRKALVELKDKLGPLGIRLKDDA